MRKCGAILFGLLFASCLTISEGDSPAATPEAVQPLPAEYRTLARILAKSMNAPIRKLTITEIIAGAEAQEMDLRGIHSADDRINQVAKLGIDALDDMKKQVEALDVSAMSKPKAGAPPAGVAVDLVAGFAVSSPTLLLHGFAQLAKAQEQQNGRVAAWKDAVQGEVAHIVDDAHQIDAGAILLRKIAATYSAPISPNDGKIEMGLLEAWGPLGNNDVLLMQNPGPDLEDCTITVEIIGPQGDTCINVHYVPKWPSKGNLVAAYSPGEIVLGQTLNQTTISHAKAVKVLIQSPAFSTRLSYDFNAEFQDKAIEALCKNMKMIGSYKKWTPLLGAPTYIATITLDGVAILPKGQIELTLHQGTTSKAFQFSFDSWKQGEAKALRDLPFNPDSTDILVSFPDTGYRYHGKIGE